MAAQKGISFLLKLGAAGVGGTLAAMRSTSYKLGVEMVEITNKDSASFRTLLEGAGTKSLSINVAGLATTDATYETFKGLAQAAALNTFQLLEPDGDTIEASFLITNFEASGDFNKEFTFTATLESSGTITFSNS
jgi:predicted secreted protein